MVDQQEGGALAQQRQGHVASFRQGPGGGREILKSRRGQRQRQPDRKYQPFFFS